jgi:hypothetical protein
MELKRLCKEMLAASHPPQKKKLHLRHFWGQYYEMKVTAGLRRRKENREIIPAIKDHNGTIITDTTEKASILNSYYAPVLCSNRYIPEIKLANSGETFIISTKVIRKRLAKSGETNQWGQMDFMVKFWNWAGKP